MKEAAPIMVIFDDKARAFAEADAWLVDMIEQRRAMLDRPILVGLCGAQGSGKSTTAARLSHALAAAGQAVAVLSLDDFYLTRAERSRLGRDVHPLLATRGVPGTHDMQKLNATIDRLLAGRGPVPVQIFDKTIDDTAPPAAWPSYVAPVDIVLLEGWCVGAPPMASDSLHEPINALERDEDPDGRWRCFINDALRGIYRRSFDRIDLSILLRAPDFAQIPAWRLEQEQRLARSPDALPAMTEPDIARFVAHYERLTRWILQQEPAELVIDIDDRRLPLRARAGWTRRVAGWLDREGLPNPRRL
jgi:D-glycerate 3-kinase